MQLSLCMIVKDEVENLPASLTSVRNLVDEIVILDTGSADGTVALAKSYGARVYESNWTNDFAAARNQALQQVQGDWVLVLDADEVLVPEIFPALRQAIQRADLLVINLIRQEVGAAQAPYSQVSRLFRRHPQICYSRPYHELIDESVTAILQREPQWQIGLLSQVAIAHHGYRPEVIQQQQKTERARTIMAAYLAEHPDDAYICSKLGGLYIQTGDTQRGIALLEQGLQASPQENTVIYELHYHLGLAYSQLQPQTAAEHFQIASQQPMPELLKLATYHNWGNLLQEQGDLQGAEQHYQQVLAIAPDFAPGYYNLGLLRRHLGDFLGAIAAYEKALEFQPDYAEAYQNLGVVYLKLGQVDKSLQAFSQAIALLETQNPSEAARLRQGLAEIGFQV